MSDVKRWAHIEGDEVINVSLWDGVTPFDPGCELVELPEGSPVGPGWSRDGSEWIAPPLSAEQQAMLDAMQSD